MFILRLGLWSRSFTPLVTSCMDYCNMLKDASAFEEHLEADTECGGPDRFHWVNSLQIPCMQDCNVIEMVCFHYHPLVMGGTVCGTLSQWIFDLSHFCPRKL